MVEEISVLTDEQVLPYVSLVLEPKRGIIMKELTLNTYRTQRNIYDKYGWSKQLIAKNCRILRKAGLIENTASLAGKTYFMQLTSLGRAVSNKLGLRDLEYRVG